MLNITNDYTTEEQNYTSRCRTSLTIRQDIRGTLETQAFTRYSPL